MGDTIFQVPKGKSGDYRFFQHKECPYFPCHQGLGENFNCLFCYCPLYALGDKCGGGFSRTKAGVKDCSACVMPHRRENFDWVMERLRPFWDEVGQLPQKGECEE